MAKRFITSDIWEKDWFLDLPSKYKVLWIYIITKADVAGIFDPNLKTVSKLLGEKYTEDDVLGFFKDNVVKVKDKWLLVKFINFQYGDNISLKMVDPINKALSKIGLSLDTLDTVSIQYGYRRHTPMDIDIEKDKDISIRESNNKNQYLEYIQLSSNEYMSLLDRMGEEKTKEYIENLNNYIGSKGKKYKSHYHTILNWYNRDKERFTPKPTQKQINSIASMANFIKKGEKDVRPDTIQKENDVVNTVVPRKAD